jgi:hypothetical protein
MVSGVAIALLVPLAGCHSAASTASARIRPVAHDGRPGAHHHAGAAAGRDSVRQQNAAATRLVPTGERTAHVTARELGKSWHPGCPVSPSGLRAVRLPYWGFDHREHQGVLVVGASLVPPMESAFRSLDRARFPIRQMQPVSVYGGSDNRSMAADNTSAFNCRLAVTDGPRAWSEHAFGAAVDIDPRENPYRLDGRVLPPSGRPYADRRRVQPGMITAGGQVVRAFDGVGWGWGGRWSSTPDYQHFSVNGR